METHMVLDIYWILVFWESSYPMITSKILKTYCLSSPQILVPSNDHKQNLEDVLFEFPTDLGASSSGRKVKMFQQYTDFLISAQKNKAEDSFRYKMLVEQVKSQGTIHFLEWQKIIPENEFAF